MFTFSAWDKLENVERPLNGEELDKIRSLYSSLSTQMDVETGLLSMLFQHKCITVMQMEFVNEERKYAKAQRVLDIIKRCSYTDYCMFVKCLRLSNQNHLADLLDHGGRHVFGLSPNGLQINALRVDIND